MNIIISVNDDSISYYTTHKRDEINRVKWAQTDKLIRKKQNESYPDGKLANIS